MKNLGFFISVFVIYVIHILLFIIKKRYNSDLKNNNYSYIYICFIIITLFFYLTIILSHILLIYSCYTKICQNNNIIKLLKATGYSGIRLFYFTISNLLHFHQNSIIFTFIYCLLICTFGACEMELLLLPINVLLVFLIEILIISISVSLYSYCRKGEY